MKFRHRPLFKLNQSGAAHIVLPAIVVLAIGAAGYFAYQTLSKAHVISAVQDSPIVYTSTATDNPYTSITNEIDASTGIKTVLSPSAQTTMIASSVNYSPDHKYSAWQVYGNEGAAEVMVGIDVHNTQTNTTHLITLPTGVTTDGYSRWYPDDSKLVFLADYSNNTLTSLATINVDGTGFAPLSGVTPYAPAATSPDTISDYAVTGDGKYVVYSRQSGVYSVAPGSPSKLMLADSCVNIRSIPSTPEGVVYTCDKVTSKAASTKYVETNKIYTATANKTTHTLIYDAKANSSVGHANMYVDSIMPSPDGKTLAAKFDIVTSTQAYCTVNFNYEIATLPLAKAQTPKAEYTSPVISGPGCEGGGSFQEASDVAWDQSGTLIAYIGGIFPTDTVQSLNVLSNLSSTATNKLLVANNVNNIDW